MFLSSLYTNANQKMAVETSPQFDKGANPTRARYVPVILPPPTLSTSNSSLKMLESTSALVDDHCESAEPSLLAPVSRCHVWGVDFDCVTMDEAVQWIDLVIQHRATTYAITANLNYLMLCDRNPRLKAFTSRCPLVLCDGKPIQWRSLLEQSRLPERVAGSDLIYRLAHLSAQKGYSIYMLGGAGGVAEKAASILSSQYPGLQIAGVHCPPFGNWSAADRDEMNHRIQDANPDILLVAFGQPKGEYWIEENYRELNVPISIQVGATFDFVAGQAKRAPEFFQRVGAEWLYRMLNDPKRLGPRYLANALYLCKALRRDLLQKLT